MKGFVTTINIPVILLCIGAEMTEPVLFCDPKAGEILSSMQIFPPDNPWNEDISGRPVSKNSDRIITSMGTNGNLDYNLDMGFIIVPPNQKKINVDVVQYTDSSDAGPYPIPDNTPIEGWPLWPDEIYKLYLKDRKASLEKIQQEGWGDRHAIIVDPTNMMLYEFFVMRKVRNVWSAEGQASVFDLKTNKLRTEYSKAVPDSIGLTSSDAAGLPIFPAVVRYDEVERGEVKHALRVTARITRREYVYPATHFASKRAEKQYPRMGERLRLRSNVYIGGYPPRIQAILRALKKYGMFVADNGGNWRISVAPNPRFNLKELNMIRNIRGSNFEVIVPTGPDEGPRAKKGDRK